MTQKCAGKRARTSPRLSEWAYRAIHSEETSQRKRAAGDSVFGLAGQRIEPQASRTDSVRLTTELPVGYIESKHVRSFGIQ